jgi:hypothetical protein
LNKFYVARARARVCVCACVRAMQPSARCLTPWLRWSGPVKNKTLMSLQDQKCSLGRRGVSQMAVGSVTLTRHAVLTRESCVIVTPLGWSNPISHLSTWVGLAVLECCARRPAAPYQYSRETSQVAGATPIQVLSRIHPGQTLLVPESHYATVWEALVVNTPLPFMGT